MCQLKKYLEQEMSMSHIYQPVMIRVLLEGGGSAERALIAKNILLYDLSQLEYYENITSNMVGRVLIKNGIVVKEKKTYRLNSYDSLSESDIDELMQLCESKIETFISRRGKSIWDHRRRNRRPIPGSIRYKVLKRAKGRCELCGVSKEERALEVDHINPVSLGGEDSMDNYQALCYICNSNKRNTDNSDFRGLDEQYKFRIKRCPLCIIDGMTVLSENELALVCISDKGEGKKIIVAPKRHCAHYLDLEQPEVNAIHRIAKEFINYTQISNRNKCTISFGNLGEEDTSIEHFYLQLSTDAFFY